MKNILTLLLVPLGVVAQAQSLVFSVSDTTSAKARLRGQSQQRTITQQADGKSYIVGLNKSVELFTSGTAVPISRTLTFTNSNGISITGGTQDLANNRTWNIGISAIDATKVGDGVVNNSEYSYLDGVSSNIQTQLDAKLSTSVAASTYLPLSGGTLTGSIGTRESLRIFSQTDTRYETRFTKTGDFLNISQYFTNTTGPSFEYVNVFNIYQNKVGINNNNPSTDLDINGSAKISGSLQLGAISNVATTINSKLTASNNLNDLASASTARTNLGLGSLATLSTVNLTSNVTGVLPIVNGGTGLSSLGSGIETFWSTPSSVNFAAAITDETGTGSVVLNTSPTFATGLTSQKIIGGTGTTSTLSLQSTSGVGATGANINFLVGNNGATTAMTISNNGNVGIGTTTPLAKLELGGSFAQTGAFISARIGGNSYEFGNPNQSGYASVLGANFGNGNPFLCFACEGGTTSNTFRTRGIGGKVITEDVSSSKLLFQRISSANADNQTPVTEMSIDNLGNVGMGTSSPSGALDVTSTSGALIIPRMTQAQRTALTGVNGSIVYQTDGTAGFYFYESGAWVKK